MDDGVFFSKGPSEGRPRGEVAELVVRQRVRVLTRRRAAAAVSNHPQNARHFHIARRERSKPLVPANASLLRLSDLVNVHSGDGRNLEKGEKKKKNPLMQENVETWQQPMGQKSCSFVVIQQPARVECEEEK